MGKRIIWGGIVAAAIIKILKKSGFLKVESDRPREETTDERLRRVSGFDPVCTNNREEASPGAL